MTTKILCPLAQPQPLEGYILKVSKKRTDGEEELVVEKKGLKSFLGRYFYSGRHTYDLDRVSEVLKNALREQPLNPSLDICCELFNNQVSIHQNSLWERITSYFSHLFGKPHLHIQQIAQQRMYQSEVSKLSLDEVIAEAQFNAIQGYIVKAASLLEEYMKSAKTKKLDEVDLCQAFDIQDDSIGTTWKGICEIDFYNQNILCVSDDDPLEPRIHTHTDAIVAVLNTHPRGFLFFRKSDQSLHIFRKTADLVEYFDRQSATWQECSDSDLRDLNLQPDDWCISLGSEQSLQKASTYFNTETRAGKRSKDGHFYHEAQNATSGSYCAAHAANAFLGYHAINISSFYQFARNKLTKSLELSRETLYRKGQDIADVRHGADPGTLIAYINELVENDVLPKRYARLKIEQVKMKGEWMEQALDKVPKDCDRAIVGYGGFHFAALRKDASNGKWYLIDSMEKESQDVAYDTLADALKKPAVADVPKTITLIY